MDRPDKSKNKLENLPNSGSVASLKGDLSPTGSDVAGSSTDIAPAEQPLKASSSWVSHPVDFSITSEEDSHESVNLGNDEIPKQTSQGPPRRELSFKLDEDALRNQIRLKRAAYTYDELEQTYLHISDDGTGESEWQKPTVEDVLPVVYFSRVYNYNKQFFPDLFAGLSVACLHLPQGLAYGLLANLTPVSGVYTSIFSVLVYVIFGTVPHMSMGTNAVLSLLTGAMVEREADRILSERHPHRHNASTPKPKTTSHVTASAEYQLGDTEERMNIKIGVAMVSTFQCGLILLLMGVFRMGFLTNYMPSSFVGGFTSAAGLHIAVSQIKHVFQIKIPVRSGYGKLVFTLMDIAKELKHSRVADAVACILSISFLVTMEEVINPAVKSKAKFILPSNLILVLIGCLVSHFLNLHDNLDIAVVGPIAGELPVPELPHVTDLNLFTEIIKDSLVQAVIVFTMSISMAMLMEKLHSYELEPNKELIAYGMCNLCSSFFAVQSSSVSPPRTMVLSSSGAKTTLNGIPTVLVLLCSVTFLAGMFQPLPLATLAAMVIVATIGILKQIQTIPKIWQVSRTDFSVWLSTFLSTTLLDLEYGVFTGIFTAALGFMVNNQRIKGELVVRSVKEDLLMPGLGRAWTKHLDKTRVFYFPSQLFFANAESFKKQLYEQVFDPYCRKKSYDAGDTTLRDLKNIHCIILDCSAITYIDIDGLNMLKTVVIRYHNAGVQMMLARCPHTTMKTLERGDFFKILPRSMVFHEVIDALARETTLYIGPRSSATYIAPTVRRVSTASLSSSRSTSIF